MYASFFAFSVGQALLSCNLFIGFASFGANATMYLLRLGSEEALMKTQFGAEYEKYCNKTPRLIPKLW